jgi:hypothetical protein
VNGVIHRLDVFVHEDDSRSWFACSLNDYLDRWLSGTLKVWFSLAVRLVLSLISGSRIVDAAIP